MKNGQIQGIKEREKDGKDEKERIAKK